MKRKTFEMNLLIKAGLYPISYNGGMKMIKLADVVYIDSSGKQSCFHLRGKHTPEVTTRTLLLVEQDLEGLPFTRINQGCLIHLVYLEDYHNGKDGKVVMFGKKELTATRLYKDNLLSIIRLKKKAVDESKLLGKKHHSPVEARVPGMMQRKKTVEEPVA